MLHPGSKCLFEPAKRTKHAASGPEMSFCNRQKDKTRCFRVQNVFLKLPHGQNTLLPGLKCPFEPAAKSTKGVTTGSEMSL